MTKKSKKPLVEDLEKRINQLESQVKKLKRNEIKLKHIEAKYHDIIDKMPFGYFEVDLDGNYTFFNKIIPEYHQRTPEELEGLNYKEYRSEEEIERIYAIYEELRKTGKSLDIKDNVIIRKDGSACVISNRVFLLKNEKGEHIGYHGFTLDITDKKQSEIELQKSKDKYMEVLETMEDEYYEVDLQGNIVFCNQALCRHTGYSRKELIGMNYRKYTSEEVAKDIFKIFNSVYDTGKSENYSNYKVLKKDGTFRFVDLSISLLKDSEGNAIGFRGISQDVTEKRKAEEAFQESEKKYRNILETMELGYFEMDLHGKYTYVNDAELNIHGLSREEMIGNRLDVKLSKDEEKKIYDVFKKIYETGKPLKIANWEHYLRKGSPIFVETSIALMKNESHEPIGFYGISRDVTEKYKSEEAIRKSEKKYRNIMETMEEGYFEVDKKGNYTFVNDAMCKIHGCEKKELIGLNNREYTSPEEAKRTFDVYNGVYKTDKPAKITDFEIIKKNGSRANMETSVYLMKNEQNEPIGFRGISRDVTERVKAEKAIRKSEEKYRTILETMGEGYYETDLFGNYTFVNDAMCGIHGYTKDELVDMNYRAYTSSEEAKRIYSIYNELYKTGEPVRIVDLEINHKDGSTRNMESSAYLMKNEQNEPIGFSGIARDVTEKKRAENALRKSEEKYRTILETMEEGYWEVDLKGNIIFCNPAELKIHGLDEDDFIGMNNQQFSSPETAKRVYKIFNEIYHTGVPAKVIDYEIIRNDGQRIEIEASAALISDENGKPVGFRGVSRDVTERIKAEKALRDSEEKYRLLVENANDGILIYQNDAILFSNKRTAEMMVYSNDELERSSLDTLIHPDDMKKYAEKKEMKMSDNNPKIFTLRIINKNGDILWIEFSSIPIQWEQKPAELIFLSDITQQKKMEVQLLQAQKMEALGTLAGGIAHDFNNLLMGIQGNASLMQLVLGENNPHIEKLKSIEKLVTDGSELTKQLLGVARGGKYEAIPADVNTIIEKSTDLFGRTKKEISIHKILYKDLWVAEVDRGQIEQVLLNLYVNAWHAMPDGGDLYVETKNVALDEYYTKSFGINPGKYIRISVTDNGIGMDEETRKKVFDPFFTTKEMGRGTGLGLASAYGIIRNHKGFINVYSEIEQGTTFNIYLPVSTKKIEEEKSSEEEIITGNETILFVDDEDAIIEVGRQLLEALGYKVLLTKSGEETIDIYKKEMKNIDLIILDMIMPGMSGGDTYDELLKINPDVKVLLASGYSLNGQAEKILERGCEGFIQKPFNLEELSKKIREVLEADKGKKANTKR